MTGEPTPHDSLVSSLQSHLERVVSACLGSATRYVLVDAPTHSNVGDHAIWLGERKLLSHIGLRPAYTASIRSLDWSVLKSIPSEYPIVLQGGGNLGDLWPHHQALREEVVTRFPHRKVVQMPQSVWFTSKDSLRKARRAFASHRDLTLMVRDDRSYHYVRDNFDLPALLCPDAALWAHPRNQSQPNFDVYALLRTDRETDETRQAVPPSLPHGDWLKREPLPRFAAAGLGQRLALRARSRQMIPGVTRVLSASFDSLSRHHLQRGVGLLSSGRVVITDRLHAHILCLLLGIAHVALDNSYGKVHGFIDTWTGASPLVHKATRLDLAIDVAHELARTTTDT
jgi:exopolysaccharide biosynthesis predicted pyruvyltransferase EpsI